LEISTSALEERDCAQSAGAEANERAAELLLLNTRLQVQMESAQRATAAACIEMEEKRNDLDKAKYESERARTDCDAARHELSRVRALLRSSKNHVTAGGKDPVQFPGDDEEEEGAVRCGLMFEEEEDSIVGGGGGGGGPK